MTNVDNNQKIGKFLDFMHAGQYNMALQQMEVIFRKGKNLKKFTPAGIEKLKLLKGICLVNENRLGEGQDIFMKLITKENSELQMDLYTMRMLATFAFHFHKYGELR